MSRARLRLSVWMVLLAASFGSAAHAQELEGEAGAETSTEASVEASLPASSEPEQAPGESEETKDKPAPNSVFFEGLGAGLYYSINYERRVIDDLGVRAGFGYVSISSSASTGSSSATAKATYLTIPITASYLGIRGRRSGLELGGGLTLTYAGGSVSSGVSSASGSGMQALGTAMVGYRLHPVDGAGFQFRVGLMALAAKGLGFNPDYDKFGVLPWFYISFGAGF